MTHPAPNSELTGDSDLPPELDVPCPPEAKEAVRRGVAMADEFARTGSVRLAAPSVEREEPSKEDIDKFKSWFQPIAPKPDVAGARERVSLWANYEFTYEDTVAVNSPLVTFTAGDLRLILSAYDRQADEIQRQGEEIERLRDKVEGLDSDLRSAVEVAYQRGAHEWASLNYPQWIVWLQRNAAARARQGGPDHG